MRSGRSAGRLLVLAAAILLGPGSTDRVHRGIPVARIDAAVAGARSYFEERGVEVGPPGTVVFLELLERHFGLSLGLPPLRDLKARHRDLRGLVLRLYDEAFDDRRVITALVPGAFVHARNIRPTWAQVMRSMTPEALREEIDVRTIWASYCDTYPIPRGFLEAIEAAGERGGYELTHAALQLQYLFRNRCVLPADRERAERLRSRFARTMIDMVEHPEPLVNDGDLVFEALSFLFFMDEEDRIRDGWIEYVLDSQLPVGGWARDSSLEEPEDHASMLAVWALLEYRARILGVAPSR